ncbi:MAG: TlyA family RNA methyltransferase [Candidatus Poribacteria bacterium]|nr:TlyA family RNA methyltransferase [Candidatus Poribacteria bacterium]
MQRIDTFLVEHDFVESREQAKRLILAGEVAVNGNTQIKPGQQIPADAKVVVKQQQKYVSRGGLKLEKALRTFDVDVQNRVALDVGASTGGFTDCLLQHGAKFVYAVDVGYGQLAWKLRKHPQVQTIDRTNIRHLTPARLKAEALNDSENVISIAVIDVSFISLRTVLPSVIKLITQRRKKLSVISRQLSVKEGDDDVSNLSDNRQPTADSHYDIIALLKPQFEAGKAYVKKGGIVSDKHVHIQTIDNLSAFVTEKLGAVVMGVTYSPIHRDIGNIEYLLWLTVNVEHMGSGQLQQTTVEVVEAAHESFGNASHQQSAGSKDVLLNPKQ